MHDLQVYYKEFNSVKTPLLGIVVLGLCPLLSL